MSKNYAEEARIAVIGTARSGKTSAIGLLYLTALDKGIKDIDGFVVGTEEKTFNIREIAAGYYTGEYGRFPPPTPVSMTDPFESVLTFNWRDKLKVKIGERKVKTGLFTSKKEDVYGYKNIEKKIKLPVIETSGEVLGKLIEATKIYDLNKIKAKDKRFQEEVLVNVLRCNGFLITVATDRIVSGVEKDDEGNIIEGITKFTDVNVAKFINQIKVFKDEIDKNAPRIEGIGIIFTKYDEYKYRLMNIGMDLSQKDGQKKFMEIYLPGTYAEIGNIGIDKVEFFPSYIEVERDEEGKPILHEDGSSYKIKINKSNRRPIYSKDSYDNLLEWIKKKF